jgi:hypothetical protein
MVELDPLRAHGRIELDGVSPVEAGVVRVDAEIRNEGELPWPAVPFGPPLQLSAPSPTRRPAALQVVLSAEWKPIDESGETGPVVHRQVVPLDRDVDPGEVVRRALALAPPAAAGRYELEVSLQQIDGPRLDRAGGSNRVVLAVDGSAAPPRAD